ncbi:MAG: hypothetical protein U0929_15265 [Planctomycetaceae bacterium]
MSSSTKESLDNKFEEVTSNVREKASQAASAIGELASETGGAVGSMASDAVHRVGQKADDITSSAGAGIKGLGDKLGQNTPQSGMMGTASQSVAKTVHDGGQYIEDAKLSGMAEDVAQMIRRNPIPAILIALGIGWIVARKMRI